MHNGDGLDDLDARETRTVGLVRAWRQQTKVVKGERGERYVLIPTQ